MRSKIYIISGYGAYSKKSRAEYVLQFAKWDAGLSGSNETPYIKEMAIDDDRILSNLRKVLPKIGINK